MKTKTIYIILFALLLIGNLNAQQDPNYSFYRYNMNLINPAYAGANETTDIVLNIRSQWAGVQDAPESQNLVFDIPAGNNVGLGLSVINDKTFIESQTSFSADFSYKVHLNNYSILYLGLKGGLSSYNANTDGLETYGIRQDPSLMNIDGRLNPNIGVGFYLTNEEYFVSISVPKILTSDRLEQKDGLARFGTDKAHLYIAGGYDFEVGSNMILKPTALMRYVEASPVSIDVTTLLEYHERFNIGASYRLNESISGILLAKAGRLNIGYAYEMALGNSIRGIDNGTHEVLLHFEI